ncbi:conserved oligomeric Golgi complex subunit 3 [Ischnura elegans]|uniref:conserved oligomeric Golgi complex subunit 3 n=1 Tax=Ischnura elegans TaxID=197161 RepID=UPI001ED8AA7A|nr:conserved oligomeric Golgi complex subunit 3 [Ischnura elegans]
MNDTTKADDRSIQKKLLDWERLQNPLAPLTSVQEESIDALSEILSSRPLPSDLNRGDHGDTSRVPDVAKVDELDGLSPSFSDLISGKVRIETSKQFLDWYFDVEEELMKENDVVYESYQAQLEQHRDECSVLLNQIETALSDLGILNDQYQLVSTKTNSLHEVSEHLLSEQNKLIDISNEVEKRLHYFTEVDGLMSRLESPTLSPSSEAFIRILDKLDECIEYMGSHPKYKESSAYLAKYKHALGRAVAVARTYVVNTFESATRQAQESTADAGSGSTADPSAKTFALLYGRFRASAPRVRELLKQVESRLDKSPEYRHLLTECHQCYVTQRELIVGESVAAGVSELTQPPSQVAGGKEGSAQRPASSLWRGGSGIPGLRGDHCAIFRSACAFLVRVCEDEYQLFFQFFSAPSPLLTAYLEGLCTHLYDALRPLVIHVNHLETLAELCSILRGEMLEDHVQASPEALEAFGKVARQLLQDVQERLVFRTYLYLRSDVQGYKPSPGDLAYPEKLEMMENIAQSISAAQHGGLRRSESRNSVVSLGSATSQEVAAIINSGGENSGRSQAGASPADLHGMWYPSVRRALACLSRLHRCVDRATFRGLSHDVLSACVESVASAANEISSKKGPIDGELFQIKHLLILREQTAPFQGDFSVTETSLDFSAVKNTAIGFVQRRISLSSPPNSNNTPVNPSVENSAGGSTWWSLLGLLAEGATPKVREQLLDSRKELDRRLKASCEAFFGHATQLMAAPLTSLLEKAGNQLIPSSGVPAANESLPEKRPFTPKEAAEAVRLTQRSIKLRLPFVLRSLRLYLANRETEFILFRPIKNNVVGSFAQLQQILNASYTAEEKLLVGCPTPEQASVLLSSSMVTISHENKVSTHSQLPAVAPTS